MLCFQAAFDVNADFTAKSSLKNQYVVLASLNCVSGCFFYTNVLPCAKQIHRHATPHQNIAH